MHGVVPRAPPPPTPSPAKTAAMFGKIGKH